MNDLNFRAVFQAAMGNESLPYAYQCRLACGPEADPENADSPSQGSGLSLSVDQYPDRSGRTAALVLAWHGRIDLVS